MGGKVIKIFHPIDFQKQDFLFLALDFLASDFTTPEFLKNQQSERLSCVHIFAYSIYA